MPNSYAWDMSNWLNATLALDPDERPTRKGAYRDEKRRVILDTGVQICWVPEGEGETAVAEVKLIVTINVYLDMTVIYKPLPSLGQDMLGLILQSLIPSIIPTGSGSEVENRSAGLRQFFACVRPAPDLPLAFLAAKLQPKEMISRLYPFQSRTVALLLQRENSPMFSNVTTPKARDPSGFWGNYELGQDIGRVAFRRITGDLVAMDPIDPRKSGIDIKGKGKTLNDEEMTDRDQLSDPEKSRLPVILDLSGVRGTMLCEEMGE